MDVKTLCLGVLTLADHTGYELKKRFEEQLSHIFPASYGSIYPALAELARAGLVTVTDVAQATRPDKKVYAITGAGRSALATALIEAQPRHRIRSEFLVQLFFSHLVPAEVLAHKIGQRIADIEATLDAVRCFEDSGHPDPARRMVSGFARVTLEAQRDYLRSHGDAFLDDLNPLPSRALSGDE